MSQSLKHIAELIHATVKEIRHAVKNINDKKVINKIISETCSKNNINEKQIRLVLFDEYHKKRINKIKLNKPVIIKQDIIILRDCFYNSKIEQQKFFWFLKNNAKINNEYRALKTKIKKVDFIKNIYLKEPVAIEKPVISQKYNDEILKELSDAKGYYISNYGRLFHGEKLLFRRLNKSTNQYRTQISYKGKVQDYRLHRTCALYFLENPNNLPDVLFKNGDNSDCRVSNLYWGTQYCIPVWNPETIQKGETCVFNFKLTEKLALEIYNAIGKHDIIAKEYNVSRAMVTLIKNKKRWRWLIEKYENNLKQAI